MFAYLASKANMHQHVSTFLLSDYRRTTPTTTTETTDSYVYQFRERTQSHGNFDLVIQTQSQKREL